MMKSRTSRLSAGVVTLGLVLAACSDDDDAAESGDPVATSEVTTEAGEMTEPMDGGEPAGEADIVDTAVSAGSFETLVTAVQAAGLEDTLRAEGPFTVFAPTDDAFDALPAGTLDSLLADPEGSLAPILTYHVVEGEVLAADVVELDGQTVTTVNGATFTVEVGEDGSVSLADAAGNTVAVTQTDIETSNGVIHVIDGVLLPG